MKQRISVAGGLLSLLMAGVATADELNLRPGVTDISQQVYDLHMTILWVCVVIGIAVFGVMFWSVIHHRRSAGYEAAKFHESTNADNERERLDNLLNFLNNFSN